MLKDEKVRLARKLRQEGLGLKEIAKQVRVSVATASLYCKGVLPKGENAPSCNQRGEYMEEVTRLYQQGVSIADIAARLNIPASTLFDWRRASGIKRNSREIYVTPELRKRIARKMMLDKDGSLRQKARYMYETLELSTPDIAKELGVTSVAVGDWLKRDGVELRKSPTIQTRLKLRKANLGDKRYNWKGGITREQMRKRQSMHMRDARNACFKRDDYTCRVCGQRGGKLNAHHVWPFQRFPKLMYELSNLVTLCKQCHDDFHKAAGGHVKIAIGPFFIKRHMVKPRRLGNTK
jgi:transposase